MARSWLHPRFQPFHRRHLPIRCFFSFKIYKIILNKLALTFVFRIHNHSMIDFRMIRLKSRIRQIPPRHHHHPRHLTHHCHPRPPPPHCLGDSRCSRHPHSLTMILSRPRTISVPLLYPLSPDNNCPYCLSDDDHLTYLVADFHGFLIFIFEFVFSKAYSSLSALSLSPPTLLTVR